MKNVSPPAHGVCVARIPANRTRQSRRRLRALLRGHSFFFRKGSSPRRDDSKRIPSDTIVIYQNKQKIKTASYFAHRIIFATALCYYFSHRPNVFFRPRPRRRIFQCHAPQAFSRRARVREKISRRKTTGAA